LFRLHCVCETALDVAGAGPGVAGGSGRGCPHFRYYREPLEKGFTRDHIAATLGSLLELARGHAVNNPSVLVPRSIAFVQLVMVVGVTALSFTFKNSPLNIVDRLALLACAASIYVGGEETIQQKVPLALIVGGACVFVAWVVDRLRTNRSNNFVAPGEL